MPVFTYEVMERGGMIRTGEREATAAEALQTNLTREGLFVIDIRRKGGLAWLGGGGGSGHSQALHDALARLTARVKITDLVLFTGQLAAMIEAGLHLLRSLTALAEETLNKYFKGVIENVGSDVAQGQSLADAMGKHPRAFNQFYVSLIRVGEASGGLPVARVRTMDEVEARGTARQRFNMVLLTIFGMSGLFMAAIGVYGVMSYSVQQRTREMGVRMALGAQVSDLRNKIISQGMLLALFGLAVGLGGAFWLTRFLTSFLFGVKAWDPIAFIVTPLLLGAVALFAVWIPARRTTRVDPMTALRLE